MSEERWVVSKDDKLDYGPFTVEQLRAQIETGQVLPKHSIRDSLTGESHPAKKHPYFAGFVEEATRDLKHKARANAEIAHAKGEKRKTQTVLAIATGTFVLLGAGAYLVWAGLSADESHATKGLQTLDEASLKVKIAKATVVRERARKKSRGKGAGGQGSWDSMNLGDVSKGSDGGERLDMDQINPVIARHGGRIGRCLRKSKARNANIRFIIKGSGKVSWVDVNHRTSGQLSSCIGSAMKRISFPSFNGSRTRASFELSI